MRRSTPVDNDPHTHLYNAIGEMEILEELSLRSERALERELEQLHNKMDIDEAELDAHQLDAYLSDMNDHYIMVSEELPLLQNYSHLLMAFSIFEKCMNDVCSGLGHRKNFPIALKDMHGQGIQRAKAYLSKAGGIADPFAGSVWSRISVLAEIRNAIAHKSGYVEFRPSDDRSLQSRLREEEHLEFLQETLDQRDRQITFNGTFVREATTLLANFLNELSQDLTRSLRNSNKGQT